MSFDVCAKASSNEWFNCAWIPLLDQVVKRSETDGVASSVSA
jgi:hypothetical protein